MYRAVLLNDRVANKRTSAAARFPLCFCLAVMAKHCEGSSWGWRQSWNQDWSEECSWTQGWSCGEDWSQGWHWTRSQGWSPGWSRGWSDGHWRSQGERARAGADAPPWEQKDKVIPLSGFLLEMLDISSKQDLRAAMVETELYITQKLTISSTAGTADAVSMSLKG